MQYFSFRALDRNGCLQSGTSLALHSSDLETRLSQRGLQLVSCRRRLFARTDARKSLSGKQLIALSFHLQQMLAAGIPLLDSLSELCDGEKHPAVQACLTRLIDAIQGGAEFSAACRQQPAVFSPLYCSLVAAGETSGRLPEAMFDLLELLKWQHETAASVRKIVLYPVFVSVVLLLVILFIMTYLVPGLLSFISAGGAELPWHTNALIGTSRIVSEHWFSLLVLLTGIALTVPVLTRKSRRIRYLCDRMLIGTPVIGAILYKLKMARFSKCAAMMYSAGIGLPELLKLGESIVDCRVLGGVLRDAREQIFHGTALSSCLAESGRLSTMVPRMLAVGESTGAIDHAFLQIAYFYEREARESIDNLEQLIGPVLIVLTGTIMMWVVVSVIGPIYDLVFSLNGLS